jgi:hypothetical protein
MTCKTVLQIPCTNDVCLTNALVLVWTAAYIVSSLHGKCWTFVRICGNLCWIFVYTETRYVPSWFLGINFVLVAAETCVSELLASNGRFVLLNYSDFQLSCHIIIICLHFFLGWYSFEHYIDDNEGQAHKFHPTGESMLEHQCYFSYLLWVPKQKPVFKLKSQYSNWFSGHYSSS